ncbi:uncharacterized protein [Leptinotarsa decemlineata]|uniref:uncharacterized protein n=1 Tax=Leptinotarsa decemlineata TaxID=7539 RepID=UPI003D30D2AE
MSFLRNALMTPSTTLSERQLEDVERRRVVFLQDIMVQPPAAPPAAAPIPPPGMTSTQEVAAPIPPPGMTSTQEVAAPDLKFFFEDFKPTPEEEEEIDPPLPPTLSTFSRPTSSSAPHIEDLLNVYNPDLDESLADLSHLQSFLSPIELLSPIDSGDEFEKPVKRAKKMKKSAPVKKVRTVGGFRYGESRYGGRFNHHASSPFHIFGPGTACDQYRRPLRRLEQLG